MRISILALGSTGDILPYAALGASLRSAGHEISFITSENFRPLLLANNLNASLIPGDAEQVVKTAGASYRSLVLGFRNLAEGLVRHAERLVPVLAESDLILNQLPAGAYGFDIADKFGVPVWLAATIPLVRTTSFPMVGWPRGLASIPGYNMMTYKMSEWLALELIKGSVNRWRTRVLGLAPTSRSQFFNSYNNPELHVLNGFSRHVVPKPTDWGANVALTGAWHDKDSNWTPSEQLIRFIENGKRPLFIGFGSMPLSKPEKTTQIVLQAIDETGQRAILHKGWGNLGDTSLPDSVIQIEYAPYEWLFPRMAAIIHHGGSGTTASALRAGIPSLIVPFLFDQFFWASRIASLGVGPKAIPIRQLTSRKLADAIRRAVEDQTMRERAQELGENLRAENGIENAIDIIEKLK